MHYLASLSSKLVAAYQNQENVLTLSQNRIERMDTRILAETVQAVLEEEIESGRLRCDMKHAHCEEEPLFFEQPEPFFAEILLHRG